MPPTKTNSNSITSIFIYALNNKKSGFREAMLKRFRDIKKSNGVKFDIPEDIVFYNGTYKSLALQEMEGTKIDIYGLSEKNNDLKIMIEIKANLEEDLQDTQKDNGAYCNTAKAYNIPLVYIIPNKYLHENDLPESDKINELVVTKIYWSEVRDIARSYDNTGLDNQIETFVQLIDNDGEDLLLTKNELALIISPNLIYTTYKHIDEFRTSLQECIDNDLGKGQNNQYGIGYYNKKKTRWLGLIPSLEKQYFFSLCLSADNFNRQDFKNQKNIYFDGDYYYCPYDGIDFMEKALYRKLQLKFSKNSDLKEWLSSPERRIREINLVYNLSDKIIALINRYNKGEEYIKEQKNENGVGAYIKDDRHFIGFNPYVESGKTVKSFSIAIKKSCINCQKINKSIINDGEWYYFPLYEETELFNAFIFSDTVDEQQETFNKLVNKTLKKTEKYLK